jgi:hypothetical protein
MEQLNWASILQLFEQQSLRDLTNLSEKRLRESLFVQLPKKNLSPYPKQLPEEEEEECFYLFITLS